MSCTSVAEGVPHGCYECGLAGHWSCDCPGKVPLSEGPGSRGERLAGAWSGRDAYRGILGRAPQDQGRRPATTGGRG
jgi:hypothetical protein